MKLKNALVQTKRDLKMHIGPLMADLIAFTDLITSNDSNLLVIQ